MSQTTGHDPYAPPWARGRVGRTANRPVDDGTVVNRNEPKSTMPRRYFTDPTLPLETLPDLYISGDVETDGPIPGSFSMLSFGLTVAGSFDGMRFNRVQPGQDTFYAELRPSGNKFEQEALDVNGLDRERLAVEGLDPREAMAAAASWVDGVAQDHRPIFVGYPAMFDWMWIYWYFIQFHGRSPFGFSGCIDLKTMIATRAHVPVSHARKSELPEELRAVSPHTHHALDDAIEQGEIFANVFEWQGPDAARANRGA